MCRAASVPALLIDRIRRKGRERREGGRGDEGDVDAHLLVKIPSSKYERNDGERKRSNDKSSKDPGCGDTKSYQQKVVRCLADSDGNVADELG